MTQQKRGRKTKYTPERVQTICDAIAATGSDEAGYKAGEISQETFYDWLKQFSEFSESVIAAKAMYRETCPKALSRACNRAITDYLSGQAERRTIVTIRREHPTNPKLNYTEVRETIVYLPPPRWVIERVLGRPMDELEAIRVLVSAGYFPNELLKLAGEQFSQLRASLNNLFLGLLPDRQRQRSAGISEETAATIRREILGDFTEDLPTLPISIDSD